jgi:hypothetical protein
MLRDLVRKHVDEDLVWVIVITCVPMLIGCVAIKHGTRSVAQQHAYTWETCAPLCVIDGLQYEPRRFESGECWCDMQRVRMGVTDG